MGRRQWAVRQCRASTLTTSGFLFLIHCIRDLRINLGAKASEFPNSRPRLHAPNIFVK